MPCSGARSARDADAAARWHGALITGSAAEFAAALPDGGKLAGLDVGTKTIGLAICDAGWHFAGPAETIRRTKFTKDLEALQGLHRREQDRRPGRRPAAQHGRQRFSPRTQSVRAFARNLAPLGLPILLWDERWSTQAVERAMIDADVSRAKRAEKVDALAAAHILQGAIDALANLPAPARRRLRGPAFDRRLTDGQIATILDRGRALVRRQPLAPPQRPSARRPDRLQPLLRKFDPHRDVASRSPPTGSARRW